MKQKKKKWYHNDSIMILLLFFFPFLGVYGILNRGITNWKRILYLLISLFFSFIASLSLLAFLLYVNISHYDEGNSLFKNGKYEEAIKSFEKVESKDENYDSAILKIEKSKKKLDSLEKAYLKKRDSLIKKAKQDSLKAILVREKINKQKIEIQKKWGDSVLKKERTYKSSFIVNYKLKRGDTIFLELSKNATKNFGANIKNRLPDYQDVYNEYQSRFSDTYPQTIVYFLPNKKLIDSNNHSDYDRPSLINKGLKVYQGNRYYKEYLGTLNCEYENPENGRKYYAILKNNGEYTLIEKYEFRNYFWVKKRDSNKRIGTGIGKCDQF